MSSATGPGPRPTRVSRQRAALIALLSDLSDFRSAQDIHSLLQERGASVGLATVYRHLAQMAGAEEVDSLVRDDGETLYRRCGVAHHHHLVCRHCGRTVEVAGPVVEQWAEETARLHGFSQVRHTVELVGLCDDCTP